MNKYDIALSSSPSQHAAAVVDDVVEGPTYYVQIGVSKSSSERSKVQTVTLSS
jgi:hypothetical protein